MAIKLLFSGDYVFSNKLSEKNYEFSDEFKKIIKEHDVFCCNLEGPIIDENCKKIDKIGPNIKNEKSGVIKLKEEGCNLFCLANNHIFDYGYNGLKETIDILDENNIAHVGAGLNKEQVYSAYSTKIKGKTVSFINIAENGFGASIGFEYGYTYAFDPTIKEMIDKSKQESDFTIVISHMGAEHWEIPLLEVREFYKSLIDLGVDAVIAHHPHVPQGWEEYKNKPIFYSLGNFIFDKGKGISNPKSYTVSIEITEDEKIKYKIIPVKFEDYVLKCDNEDYTKLAELLKDDNKYNKLLENKILCAYEKYKYSYFKVVSRDKGNLKELIKGFIKRNIFREKFQDKWLYHNLNIETHLWICKRATRIITENKINDKSNN